MIKLEGECFSELKTLEGTKSVPFGELIYLEYRFEATQYIGSSHMACLIGIANARKTIIHGDF